MNYEKPDPLPKGWATKTIDEFVEDGRAIGYGVLKPGPHVEGGVRLIRSNQVQDGWIDLSNDYRVSPKLDQEFKRTRLSGGELLFRVTIFWERIIMIISEESVVSLQFRGF